KRAMYAFGIYMSILMLPCALSGQDPAIHNQRGVEYGNQKEFEKAILEFDKALEQYNKNSARVYHNKGWVFEQENKFDDAIKNYEEATRRNPAQIVSFERLGYMYYRIGKYDSAVEVGEHVLKMDPKNQSVIAWLPDAYAKRLHQRKAQEVAKQESATISPLEDPCKHLQKKKEEPPKRPLFFGTYDFVLRFPYYFSDDEGRYQGDPGLGVNVPNELYLNYSPFKMLEFDVKAGNPYLGTLLPNLLDFSETFQMIYHLGLYYLGIGIMINHYYDEFNYGELTKLYDYKVGLIFGAVRDNYSNRFIFYPRELPHDGKHSSGKTLDVDYIAYEFRYFFDRYLTFHLLLSMHDFYFFDHDAGYSNYWGLYKIGFGLSLTQYDSATDRKFLVITVDFTLNIYLKNLENDEPYRFFNGQGWYGADADSWFAGNPFSGFYGAGHVFSLKVEEWINKNFFLYQKIIFELADAETDHHELAILLGGGTSW
ncbi:MAG: hypothetical protein N2316_04815, partial [Spirochaetes bacterium]|nr:hypothetical protein [Spirochaetota bacterium]